MKRTLYAALAGFVALAFVATASAVGFIRTDENVGYTGAAYPVGAIIDLSTASTTTSDVVEMRVLSGMSVQIDHGNIVGTLAIQSSNDDLTYYPVQGGSFAAISGAGGETVELGSMRSRYYRFVYTHSSGTGLLKVTVHVKGK